MPKAPAEAETPIQGTDSYSSEDRLTKRQSADGSNVRLVYDGDGNLVQQITTRNGITESVAYLVDTLNPTGYSQVLEEQINGTVTKVYTFGHDLISQDQRDGSGNFAASFYGYDGHGSVRLLTNELGQPIDSYTYDAFGELIHKTGSTANDYLYCGERYSGGLGLYHLRARFMSTNYGRFWNMDSFEGRTESPGSLHKFTYAHANPVSYSDPSGNEIELSAGLKGIMAHALFYFYCMSQGIPRWFDEEIGTSLQLPADAPNRDLRPDVVDAPRQRWFELKPIAHRSSETLMEDGYRGGGGTSQQLATYRSVMGEHGYSPGFSFDLVPGRRFIGIAYDNMLRPLLTFIEPADPITSIGGGRHDTRGLIYYWFRRCGLRRFWKMKQFPWCLWRLEQSK